MIVFNNKGHGARIAKAIPRQFNAEVDPVISSVGAGGELLGGCIYDGYTGAAVFIHQASFSKHWLSRDMLWAAFHFPFVQLGCTKLCGTIPSTNARLLDINLKFGFHVEACIEDAYPGGDMLVLSMTRSQCRWLNLKPRHIVSGMRDQ